MEGIKTTTRQKNILVIDSDQDVINEMSDYLNSSADTVLNMTFVKSVKEAMRKMADKNFDLIIMEIILPIVNGYFFLDHLKKTNPDQSVLVYTRLKSNQDLSRLATYSIENVVLKKVTKTEPFMRWLDQGGELKADLSKRIIEIQNMLKSESTENGERLTKVLQCSRCGMVLNRSSRFCNNCGQKVIRPTAKPLQVQKEIAQENEKPADNVQPGNANSVKQQTVKENKNTNS